MLGFIPPAVISALVLPAFLLPGGAPSLSRRLGTHRRGSCGPARLLAVSQHPGDHRRWPGSFLGPAVSEGLFLEQVDVEKFDMPPAAKGETRTARPEPSQRLQCDAVIIRSTGRRLWNPRLSSHSSRPSGIEVYSLSKVTYSQEQLFLKKTTRRAKTKVFARRDALHGQRPNRRSRTTSPPRNVEGSPPYSFIQTLRASTIFWACSLLEILNLDWARYSPPTFL